MHVHRALDITGGTEQKARDHLKAILSIHDDGRRNYAILSAENPSGKTLSAQENVRRTQELASELMLAGHLPIPAYGTYVFEEGPAKGTLSHERSFLVRLSSREALKLARRFGQEYYIHAGLLLRSSDNRPIRRFRPEATVIGPDALKINPHTEVRIDGWTVVFALRE